MAVVVIEDKGVGVEGGQRSWEQKVVMRAHWREKDQGGRKGEGKGSRDGGEASTDEEALSLNGGGFRMSLKKMDNMKES